MQDIKNLTFILLAFFLFAFAGAALFFSYKTYRFSTEMDKQYRQSIRQLVQEIASLKDQLAIQGMQAEADSTQIVSRTGNAVALKSKEAPLASQREAVRRLEKIIESTGLEQLAANGTMDPTVLSEMYDEYSEHRHAAEQHEMMLQTNMQLHKADEDRYGPELMALYERARLRRRSDAERQESDRAFAELMAKYPDAYATGMAISERALISGFRRNTSEVEKYYEMLRQNENFAYVVTDRGIEAMPNIEYYLARQYLRQGRIDSAQTLIESLEKNYLDSRLFTGRFGGRQHWQPVSQVIYSLRQEAESLR